MGYAGASVTHQLSVEGHLAKGRRDADNLAKTRGGHLGQTCGGGSGGTATVHDVRDVNEVCIPNICIAADDGEAHRCSPCLRLHEQPQRCPPPTMTMTTTAPATVVPVVPVIKGLLCR
eukprot:gene10066-biopygen9546